MSATEITPVPHDEVVQTAFALADSVARSDIECIGRGVVIRRMSWYDLQSLDEEDHAVVVTALRYLHLRGDALPFRVICHPERPFLRRFEPRC